MTRNFSTVHMPMLLTAALFVAGAMFVRAQTVSTPDAAARNENTVRRFYDECLNRKQLGVLPELADPGVINHFNDKDEMGIDAFGRAILRVAEMFPDGRFVIEDIVASGNYVAAHWSMTATNSVPVAGRPATGKKITERAVVFYRFEREKIAEVWLQVDQIGLLRQLDVKQCTIDVPAR